MKIFQELVGDRHLDAEMLEFITKQHSVLAAYRTMISAFLLFY
jgi:hypothetical protein